MERLPLQQLCPNSPLELPEHSPKPAQGAAPSRLHSAPGKCARNMRPKQSVSACVAHKFAAAASSCHAGPMSPPLSVAERSVAAVGLNSGGGEAAQQAGDLAALPSTELPADWQRGLGSPGASPVPELGLGPGVAIPDPCAPGNGASGPAQGPFGVRGGGLNPYPILTVTAGVASPTSSLPDSGWAAELLDCWDVRWQALLSPRLSERPHPALTTRRPPPPDLPPARDLRDGMSDRVAAPDALRGGSLHAGPPLARDARERAPLAELVTAAEAVASDAPCASSLDPAGGRVLKRDQIPCCEDGGGGGDDTDDLLALLLRMPGASGEESAAASSTCGLGADGAWQGTARVGQDALDTLPTSALYSDMWRSVPAAHPHDGAPANENYDRDSPQHALGGESSDCGTLEAVMQRPAQRPLQAGHRKRRAENVQDGAHGVTHGGHPLGSLRRPTASSSGARSVSPQGEPGEWVPEQASMGESPARRDPCGAGIRPAGIHAPVRSFFDRAGRTCSARKAVSNT